MRKTIGMFVLIFFFFQSGFAQDPVLEEYIDSALTNNVVLQQKNVSLEKASYALREARGLFYPDVSFQADYVTADGGRDIPLPLGDLLNGVYATLNKLTQTQDFPRLQNQKVNFLPTNFYDAKIHTEVPIFNRKLHYNKRIKAQQVQLSAYEVTIYKRELVEKVKTAYYQYLQALDALRIYHSALELAEEGKRVNERLLSNGKGLPAYVLRAESEIETVKARLTTAVQEADNARRYFNFLLNRDQRASIDTAANALYNGTEVLQLLNTEVDVSSREELKELKEAVALQQNFYSLNESVYYPSLNGFLDLGSQAENWQFNNQSRYYMVGLSLKIPLFEGGRNKNKMRQARLSVKDARLNLKNTLDQLHLSGKVSQNKLRSAYHNFLSSQKRLKSARVYQRLINRGYKEGTNTYIETIDARNQLTQAQMAVSMNRYKMLEAQAKLERVTASYPLK